MRRKRTVRRRRRWAAPRPRQPHWGGTDLSGWRPPLAAASGVSVLLLWRPRRGHADADGAGVSGMCRTCAGGTVVPATRGPLALDGVPCGRLLAVAVPLPPLEWTARWRAPCRARFFCFWRAGEAATTGGGESPPAVCHGRERRRVEGASRSPPPRAASVVTPPQPTGARGGKAGAIQLWASGGDAPPPPRSGCLCRARVARGAARDRLPAKNKNTKTEAASPLPACQGANSCSSRIFVLRVRRDAGRGHRRPPGTLPRQRCSASVAPPASKGRGYATCQYQPPISHAHSRRAHPKVRRVRTSRVWITAAERRTTRDGWRVVAAAPRGEKRSRADAR